MCKLLRSLVLSVLFPPFCGGCDRLGTYLCQDCYELCVFNPFPIRLSLEPLYLDSISAPLEFSGPLVRIIHAFKYKQVKPLGKVLATILFYTSTFPEVDGVSSVPLHPKRVGERGFNQASELGIPFASLLGVPFVELLMRTKHMTSQTRLSREERLKHLSTSFSPRADAGLIPKRVLLIDDVVTTGATLNECAKVLKEMGVREVHGLVVAHGVT